VVAAQVMERTMGDAAEPYRRGPASVLSKLSLPLAAGGRSRPAGIAGAACVLAGTLLERLR
jgi:hypothetical protein